MPQDPGSMLVTYHALELAAREVHAQAKNLEGDLAAIKAQIASVSELWVGKAREEYNTSQAQWDQQARNIHNSLAQISKQIDEAVMRYKSGDAKAASYFTL
ncbi:WXG100 family type VII secretion target [Streptomyces sp. NPDC004111]|uniref:WXG100 family type VII secretion target n=1 Tax=Streptomyces sp. NPDC004111 TaxID=3364690 RepID=UPI00369581BB